MKEVLKSHRIMRALICESLLSLVKGEAQGLQQHEKSITSSMMGVVMMTHQSMMLMINLIAHLFA